MLISRLIKILQIKSKISIEEKYPFPKIFSKNKFIETTISIIFLIKSIEKISKSSLHINA